MSILHYQCWELGFLTEAVLLGSLGPLHEGFQQCEETIKINTAYNVCKNGKCHWNFTSFHYVNQVGVTHSQGYGCTRIYLKPWAHFVSSLQTCGSGLYDKCQMMLIAQKHATWSSRVGFCTLHKAVKLSFNWVQKLQTWRTFVNF